MSNPRLHSADLFTGQLVRMAVMASEDREVMARWSNDPEYLRLLDSSPARPRIADNFLVPRSWSGSSFDFTVRTLADDRLIGFVELWTDWPNQTGGIGIGIGDPEYRGRGYGPDALRLVVNYGFRELNLYRLGLNVFSYNTRAIRAYEKVGFVHEGRLRAALYREGQHHDLVYMSVIRPEWFARMGWTIDQG